MTGPSEWLGSLRRSWWQRSHRKIHEGASRSLNQYALNAGTREAFQALVKDLGFRLQPGNDDIVLDLGGGDGCLSREVFDSCRRLVVMDLCAPRDANAMSFIKADMYHPPFQSEAFTRLFTYSTFPHLGSSASAVRMLKTWDRLLKPGGVLFIGDIPDRSKLGVALTRGFRRLSTFKGFKYYFAVSMVSMFSKTFLVRSLQDLGYQVAVLQQSPGRRFHRERFDLLAKKIGINAQQI